MCKRCAWPEEDIEQLPPDSLPHVSLRASFGPDEEIPLLTEVGVEDSGLYKVTCLLGHHTELVLTAPKFDVLFESGALAFLDGYYREAVSSFGAALERFYEHWIKAVLLNTRPAQAPDIASTFKLVAAQSERQLGAFAFLYFRDFGLVPKLLRPTLTQFRNDVIHKGKIPTRTDAFDYGDAIALYISQLYRQLYDNCLGGLTLLRSFQMEQSRRLASNPDDVSPMTIQTVLSHVAGLDPLSGMVAANGMRTLGATQVTFESALDDLRQRRLALKCGRVD